MAFFTRCISGSSLKGMVRGDADDDDYGGSGSTTPNDTLHGGSKFSSSYSWKRLSAKSRSSLNSPKKPHAPPLSATSTDGTGPPRASMEPVMERTRSALTDLEAVKFLVEDWSHKHWRPATPQDQERFDRLEQGDIKPLVALGEGAYGSVNLCRIPAREPSSITAGGGSSHPAASPFSMSSSQTQFLPETASAPGGSGTSGTQWEPPPGLGLANSPSVRSSQSVPLRTDTGTSSTTNGGASGVDGGVAADLSAAAVAEDGDGASAPLPPPQEAAPDASTAEAAAAQLAAAAAAAGEAAGLFAMHPASSINDPQLIVAVKRVPLGWNQERELMQLHRCQQCPFIVRLFGFVEDGSEHCNYVMEWAEGGDLGVMLASLKDRRGGNKQRLLMSETSARYYMGCLLLALEFLHGNGLLHRDIKPSNLLLTSDGTAKLADLGFTVALDANGHTVGCCGTTGYIAPEVYGYGTSKSRMAYGMPADIWSAGATLYQILTGNVVTDKPEEMLKKGWRPPTHERFSHQLQDLLNRMLSVKPTARPQSATSVMRHPWFASFDWAALREGRMKAPYVPSERRRRGAHGAAAANKTVVATAVVGGAAAAATAAANAVARVSGGGGPPPAGFGAQRLAPVLEGVSSPSSGREGGKVVQRSALSGQGEGSVRRGREGLVRHGSSFETALGTVTTAEAQAALEGAAAVAAAAAATGSVGPSPSTVLPLGQRGGDPQGHGHGNLTVRFAVGVAECA